MIYFLAFITDLIIGDPFKFHPIIKIGNTIKKIEKFIYKDKYFNGFLLLLFTILIFIIPIYIIRNTTFTFIFLILKYYIIYSLIATKSLYKETLKVVDALKKNNIKEAKKLLSYVVSRDTTMLNEQQIKKALIETISENTIDGVIAPLFYLALGAKFGIDIELLVAYKIVNTLDSMVGYKNKKYRKFGYFSAKTDDYLNFIPARIGSFVMLCSGLFYSKNIKKSISIFLKNRNNQTSPNAGYPEAAIAGILDIKLAGPSTYFGNTINKLYIGNNDRLITLKDITITYKVLFISSSIFLLLMIGVIYGV